MLRTFLKFEECKRTKTKDGLQYHHFLFKLLKRTDNEYSPNTLRHEGFLRNILKGESGKKRRRPRLQYSSQIIKYVKCKTFRQEKKLVQSMGYRIEWRRVFLQTSLRTVYSMLDDNYIFIPYFR